MSVKPATIRVVLMCAALLICGDLVHSHAQRRRHAKKAEPPAVETTDEEQPAPPGPIEVRLKLKDGSRMIVDDAWESAQGFWYKRGGITYLITRDRATAIERGPAEVRKAEPQMAKVTQTSSPTQT